MGCLSVRKGLLHLILLPSYCIQTHTALAQGQPQKIEGNYLLQVPTSVPAPSLPYYAPSLVPVPSQAGPAMPPQSSPVLSPTIFAPTPHSSNEPPGLAFSEACWFPDGVISNDCNICSATEESSACTIGETCSMDCSEGNACYIDCEDEIVCESGGWNYAMNCIEACHNVGLVSSLVVIILFLVFVITFFYCRRKYRDADNFQVITFGVGVIDILTDYIVCYELWRIGLTTEIVIGIAAICITVLANVIFMIFILPQEFRNTEVSSWFRRHVCVAGFGIVCSALNINVLNILSANLFDLDRFRSRFSYESVAKIQLFGVVHNLTEDAPFIAIQIIALSRGYLCVIAVVSLCISFISVFIGLVRRIIFVIKLKYEISQRAPSVVVHPDEDFMTEYSTNTRCTEMTELSKKT